MPTRSGLRPTKIVSCAIRIGMSATASSSRLVIGNLIKTPTSSKRMHLFTATIPNIRTENCADAVIVNLKVEEEPVGITKKMACITQTINPQKRVINASRGCVCRPFSPTGCTSIICPQTSSGASGRSRKVHANFLRLTSMASSPAARVLAFLSFRFVLRLKHAGIKITKVACLMVSAVVGGKRIAKGPRIQNSGLIKGLLPFVF